MPSSKLFIRKGHATHSEGGMSLIELLTAVIIIGVATAGTMELAYVNAYWAANSTNKADNLYAARRFLDVLSRDLRNAIYVDSSSTASTLIITRSQDLSGASVDANGFPLKTSPIQIVYTVVLDQNSIDLSATDYLIQRQESGGASITVLSGLVGPTIITGAGPGTFQYSSASNPSNAKDGLTANPTVATNSVVVNLELKRLSFDKATQAMNESTNHSYESIRSEVFLRNSNLGAGL